MENFIFCVVFIAAINLNLPYIRGRSMAAATSKMERFVIIVNG